MMHKAIHGSHNLDTNATLLIHITMGETVQEPPADANSAAPVEGEAPAGPSKSELKKRAKEAEKAKKAAERLAREEEERKTREAAASVDNASQNYGKSPLHQSQERSGRDRLKFPQLSKEHVGKEVIFRARLHNMRPQGAKIVFLQFRQQTETLQGVLVASGEKDEHQVSKQMLKFAQGITVS
jgi:aspartyl-tRNA synthetase